MADVLINLALFGIVYHYDLLIVLRCKEKINKTSHVNSVAFLLRRSEMPRRPKKPCGYPGCPNLTDETYCDVHKTQMTRQYETYGREEQTSKRYGHAWKEVRKRYVSKHPFCEMCFAKGIIVPVDEVHHKLPLAEGGTNDEANLISLCKSCHAKIHGERGDYQGRKKNKVYSY